MCERPAYLDCNATTPIEPSVLEVALHFLREEYGNEGSRTHEYGAAAKRAVQKARDHVSALVGAKRDEVIFTSGATESNNLALLGLAAHGEHARRRHVIASTIEHKAVLEPLEEMDQRGFEVTLLRCGEDGRIDVDQVERELRPDTLLVTMMHVNNETGIVQPLNELCSVLKGHEAFLHVDAAQGYGKELNLLRNERVDLISVSGHKVYAPKGVGALIARRRGYDRPPLKPLLHGGGQERGLRPGTLPVHLIAALGEAARLAELDFQQRRQRCQIMRDKALSALMPLGIEIHGAPEHVLNHVLNFTVPGLDSEALMLGLKDLISISNGSACTSHSYAPSHVLDSMGLAPESIAGAVRLSWSHLTPEVDWEEVANRIRQMM